jgi:hypothetical protein
MVDRLYLAPTFFSNKFQELLKHIFALSIFPPQNIVLNVAVSRFLKPSKCFRIEDVKDFQRCPRGKIFIGRNAVKAEQ